MSAAVQDPTGLETTEEIDAYLAANEWPHVDGNRVTFVYRGDADEVALRHWIFGLTSRQELARVAGTNLWHLTIDLPERSRVEYKLEVIEGENARWVLDPLNPHRAHDPFGANSVCQSSGYEFPEWASVDPESRTGALETLRFRSTTYDDERSLRVYLPARFRRRTRYPLLVVHDGDDYLRYSGLKAVLDNLTHRLEIPPMIVALTNPVDRLVEYAASEKHASFLVDELLPFLESSFPLVGTPATRGLVGASFGAVATLSTAWRHPGVFGKLLLQSGSFGFSDIGDHDRGPAFDPVVEFVNEFRERPGRPSSRAFVSCGVYESLIYENRSMLPVFQSTGMDVRYIEARDGHNWENWRDRLREGLSWLFPGPMWMVYE